MKMSVFRAGMCQVCVLAAIILTPGLAQTSATQKYTPDIRVQADLVLINASVTDAHGRPVPNIDPSRFHIFEDGT